MIPSWYYWATAEIQDGIQDGRQMRKSLMVQNFKSTFPYNISIRHVDEKKCGKWFRYFPVLI